MKDKSIWGIIFLCITINHRATEIYLKLSKAEKNNVLKTFWSEMAEEEIIHASFWKIVEKAAKGNRLPDVFDDPAGMRGELCVLLEKIEVLLSRWEERCVSSKLSPLPQNPLMTSDGLIGAHSRP